MSFKPKIWWQRRSVRERTFLSVMGAVTLIMALWLGIYRPLSGALINAREHYAIAVTRYYAVVAKTRLIRIQAQQPRDASADDILNLVSQSAEAAGFTPGSIRKQAGGRLALSISTARYGPLLKWIGELEKQHILVEKAVLTPSDQAGTVHFSGIFMRQQIRRKPG
tara:strand:+ start:270 stop:767 length:498 start_codon:yes stop_codon:yes gene_type:complete